MPTNPLTFVICTYNQSDHSLPLILHSLAVQTRKAFNVQVWHDGRSVSTALVCRQFEESLNISYFENPENIGDFGYTAREKSLEIIETKYWASSGADNIYTPGFVEFFLNTMERDSLDFAYCDLVVNYNNCNGRGEIPWNVMESTPQQNRIDIMNWVCKTEHVKRIGFPIKDRFADGRFVTELMLTPGLKYAKIPSVLCVHC